MFFKTMDFIFSPSLLRIRQTALRENFPEKRRITNKLIQLQNNKRFWNLFLVRKSLENFLVRKSLPNVFLFLSELTLKIPKQHV